MILQDAIINFLGDSITEGVGTSGPEHIYTHLIESRCHLRRANNYGISGTRIARQLHPLDTQPESFQRDFCSRVKEMDPAADAVVVFGGTNDFGHGDAPIGTPDDRSSDTFYGACHVLMSSLVERYPGKPVVICTPLHRMNEEDPCGDNKSAPVATLSEYTRILCEVARWYGLPVLDLGGVTGIQPRNPVLCRALCPDGLHPNDAGHEIIASRIAGFLSTL